MGKHEAPGFDTEDPEPTDSDGLHVSRKKRTTLYFRRCAHEVIIAGIGLVMVDVVGTRGIEALAEVFHNVRI